jgi:hypothetical protein
VVASWLNRNRTSGLASSTFRNAPRWIRSRNPPRSSDSRSKTAAWPWNTILSSSARTSMVVERAGTPRRSCLQDLFARRDDRPCPLEAIPVRPRHRDRKRRRVDTERRLDADSVTVDPSGFRTLHVTVVGSASAPATFVNVPVS